MSDAPSQPVHVMLVEDHELLAESLRLALVAEGMSVVVPPLQPHEILAAAAADRPAVVLLDLDLGSAEVDGSVLVEPLVLGGSRVVVVSGTSDRIRIAGCVESGAHGFVSKSEPLEVLLAAVRATALGEPVMAPAARQDLLAELRRARTRRRHQLAPFQALTGREAQVLSQIMSGRSAAEIAQASFVSEATIRTQIRAVLEKLGVRSQLAAVAEARRVGWHGPEPQTGGQMAGPN